MKKIYPEKTDSDLTLETNQLNQQLNESSEDKEFISIIKSFTDVDYRKASWLCAAFAFFVQYAGINFVLVYATLLIEKLDAGHKKSSISPGLSSGIIGVFAFIGPILSIKLFQKVGRKGIILGGFLGCCVFHTATAVSYSLGSSIMCLLCMSSIVLIWQMTLGCCFFVYICEVLSGAAIGTVNGVGLLSLCSISYLSPMVI